jgi:hypothetical protein
MGAIIHHYGRWVFTQDMGWIWTPGAEVQSGLGRMALQSAIYRLGAIAAGAGHSGRFYGRLQQFRSMVIHGRR